MINVDQLEVLLRTIPQYFLFGSLSLYLFGWIDRKPLLGTIADALVLTIGILATIVLTSRFIPSPLTDGLIQEHVEMVITMLTLLAINGALAAGSLVLRYFRKKAWNPLVFAIFVLAVYIFFASTKLSKIKFELNVPTQTETIE